MRPIRRHRATAAGGMHETPGIGSSPCTVPARGRSACAILSRAADHPGQPLRRGRPGRPARAHGRRGDERGPGPSGRRRQPPGRGHRNRRPRRRASQARRLHAFHRGLAVARDHAGADEGRGLRRHRLVRADRHRRRRSERADRTAEPPLQERAGARRRRPERGRQPHVRHGRGRQHPAVSRHPAAAARRREADRGALQGRRAGRRRSARRPGRPGVSQCPGGAVPGARRDASARSPSPARRAPRRCPARRPWPRPAIAISR